MNRSRASDIHRAARVLLIAALGAFPAAAQQPIAAFEGRLDPAIRTQVERVVAAARAESLPAAPLINKALEGASKQASGSRIVAAVQALAGYLKTAREALGPAATDPEITIGADALRTGATAATLRTLHTAVGARSLTVPLAVLSTLVGRGVPVDTATTVVMALAARRGSDHDFLALQRAIERDISAGMAPGAAASVRAATGPPANVPARGGRPGPPSSHP